MHLDKTMSQAPTVKKNGVENKYGTFKITTKKNAHSFHDKANVLARPLKVTKK
jgi:hypothetical protein